MSQMAEMEVEQDENVPSSVNGSHPADPKEHQQQHSKPNGLDEHRPVNRLGVSTVPGLDELWLAVSSNFQDFDSWTKLLTKAESCEDIQELIQAYDAFLGRYPLCFGYWKKYADNLKKRKLPTERVVAIFERGVVAIPLSIDLWIHYLNYLMNNIYKEKTPEDTAAVRKIFDRAINASGLEFKSDKLWDMYINWETENKEFLRVTAIYDRLFKTPTKKYEQHYQKLKEHVREHGPQASVNATELVSFIGKMPKEDVPREFRKLTEADLTATIDFPELVTKKLQDLIIDDRKQVYRQLEKEMQKILAYEEAIRRNYFHVKPLEKSQITNWKSYIDYMLENSTQERIIFLFERCLITCAYYEEFWVKYIGYLEEHGLIERAQEVYKRGGGIHLPGKIGFHTQWANFEEKYGFKENAARVLTELEKMNPEVVSIAVHRCAVYRRMWSLSKAAECLENALSNARERNNIIFLTIKLSRFKAKMEGNYNAAIELVEETLKKYPINERLHLHLVDLEYSRPAVNVVSACKRCDDVMDNTQMPLKTKLKFAQRKIEFLEDFGNDPEQLTEARKQFEALLLDDKDPAAAVAAHHAYGSENLSGSPPPDKRAKMDAAQASADYSSYYYSWPYYATAGQTQYATSATSYQQYAQYWAAAANQNQGAAAGS